MTYLQLFLIVGLPLMGLVYALLGGIKLALAQRAGLDEAQVGRLVSGFGMMVGPTILACGFLTDTLGRKPVFMTGAVMVVAAIGLLATTRAFRGALLGVLLLGAGWSATINVANVLMWVSVEDPDKLMGAINAYDCVFGLGAFLTPVVLAVVLRRFRYTGGLLLLAVVSAVPVAMGAFADMHPDKAAAAATASAGLSGLLTSAGFWLPALAFLFYAPLETSVSGWATTLVSSRGGSEKLSAGALSGFWLCFTGSRFVMAVIGQMKDAHLSEQLVLQVLSVFCMLLMLGIVFLRGRGTSVALVLACGLVFGPIFPALMTALRLGVPPGAQGRAIGFFFAFASVGWTVIPMLIGSVTRRTDLRRGFGVAVASAAVFTAFVVARGLSLK